MPAQYAHYRFGKAALAHYPAELLKSVTRLRGLYDLGLQGPDPLLYHSYISRTPVCELGSRLHIQTGREFFTRCCDRLRREPTEEGRVYLYGVLGHFCLDSHCHPFVDAQDAVSHFALETEFDRYLLERDGHDLSRRGSPVPISLAPSHARIIAGLYPSITPRQLRHSVRSMALAQKLLSTPSGAGRKIVARALRRSHFRDLQLTERVDKRCFHLNAQLLQRFDRALEQYPLYLEQLNNHLNHGALLGAQFSANFG